MKTLSPNTDKFWDTGDQVPTHELSSGEFNSTHNSLEQWACGHQPVFHTEIRALSLALRSLSIQANYFLMLLSNAEVSGWLHKAMIHHSPMFWAHLAPFEITSATTSLHSKEITEWSLLFRHTSPPFCHPNGKFSFLVLGKLIGSIFCLLLPFLRWWIICLNWEKQKLIRISHYSSVTYDKYMCP